MREESTRRAREEAEAKAAAEFARREEERIAIHKQEEAKRLQRDEASRKEPQAHVRPVQEMEPANQAAAQAQAEQERLRNEQAQKAADDQRRREETAAREQAVKDKKSIRVAPPVAVALPAPAPVPPAVAVAPSKKEPGIPLRTRLSQAGVSARKKLAAIPWQVWRTLAGLIVLALAWVWIARACEKSKSEPPSAPAATRPLIAPCRPAPEPYLD